MLMSTLTICKSLCGMPKKRTLFTQIERKPKNALEGTYDTQINFQAFASSFLCPEEMTWPQKSTFTRSFRLHMPLVRKQRHFLISGLSCSVHLLCFSCGLLLYNTNSCVSALRVPYIYQSVYFGSSDFNSYKE